MRQYLKFKRSKSSRGHIAFGLAIFSSFIVGSSILSTVAFADGWNPNSRASNRDSILNTRHNLTLSYNTDAGGAGNVMNLFRNNYFEVCVYCHTPHGANRQVNAPLWNRTINTTSYTIYDKPRTLNRPIGQPGPNSLTCLSCHDGTISIDSIINMPGSGGYSATQETGNQASTKAFLDTWQGIGPQNSGGDQHFVMGKGPDVGKCTLCHNTDLSGTAMSDFTVFTIGTDLRDDHPIGIQFPVDFATGGVDFNEPTLDYVNPSGGGHMKVFDINGNGYPDKGEPRLYDSGDGPEVECASCHDPHGVPRAGDGSVFIPSFLRVSNGIQVPGAGGGPSTFEGGRPSGLCLTCHLK